MTTARRGILPSAGFNEIFGVTSAPLDFRICLWYNESEKQDFSGEATFLQVYFE